MTVIKVKPVTVTPEILDFLERRKLIKALRPPADLLDRKSKHCVVRKIYSTAPRFGTHKLICVNLNQTTKIILTSHPDNEEFIILNNTQKNFKPLYLIIGLHKDRLFEKLARNGKIEKKDVMVIKLKYNDPATCIFTMLKGTPHCEITSEGRGISPIFFVTEPDRLTMKTLDLFGYTFTL